MDHPHARLTPRYSFVVDIELTDVQSGIQIKERTKDLSLFGCGVDTLKALSQGTSVRIKISHEGRDAVVLGRVAYARSELGTMGVAFTSVDSEDERVLVGWIAELRASQSRNSELCSYKNLDSLS